MLSEDNRDQISNQIAALFQGLDVEDVAGIMTVQLAMLTAQGAESPDDAVQFLDDIRDDVEIILRSIPPADFQSVDEDDAGRA